MNATPTSPVPAARKGTRRGVVLVSVLVVIVLLSLAGYQYNEMMLQEYRVSENAHRSVQAKALADSGIYYAAAMLGHPDNFNGVLGGNPWNNPEMFKAKLVQGDDKIPKGYFSLIAPPMFGDASAGDIAYGVIDESGKININAIMQIDVKKSYNGQYVHDMLIKLPNMTEEIANAIIDWMDPDSEPRTGGAEDEYYGPLGYRCKNGPIDSIDELLLVKDVTRELLYGTDPNRNGTQDEEEGASGFDRGWSAFLTVHSREQNFDQTGKPFVFLNNTDLTQLHDGLVDAGLDEDLVKFVIMYRQYSLSLKPKKDDISVTTGVDTVEIDLAKAPYDNQIKSIFDLVNAQISVRAGTDPKTKKNIYKVYKSPLSDQARQRDLLPKLFAVATLVDPSVTTEIPARININTAPPEVLATLLEWTGLTDVDIDKIATLRNLDDPICQTPAWLLTEAKIDLKKLKNLDEWVTTRTQVYRVQSVGYFEGKGPAIRVEGVIDINSGRPRIIAYRNLTELGKGWKGEMTP